MKNIQKYVLSLLLLAAPLVIIGSGRPHVSPLSANTGNVILPEVTGYTPTPNGYVVGLKFDLTPGGNYLIEYSEDGGSTWPLQYPFSVSPQAQPAVAYWLAQIAVPGGIPVRMVQQ